MRKILKELGSHSLTYLVGNIAISASSILMLPLYTRYLSKSDYGILEIIDSLSSMLMILFMSGLGSAYGKFHNEANTDKERKVVFGTTFWFILVSSTVWIGALAFFQEGLAKVLLGSSSLTGLMGIGLVSMWINPVYILGTYYLNVHKMPGIFLMFSLGKLFVNVACNLFFIVHLSYGAKGMLYGEIISSVSTGLILFWIIVRRNGLPFNPKLLKHTLVFGLPFVPSLLCAALMHRADRYLLQQYTDLASVGIYGIGYKFPFMLGSLLLQSFGRIWGSSTQYEIAKQKNWQHLYSRVTTYFFVVVVIAEISVGILAPTILEVLTTPPYFPAAPVIQILAVGFCIYSLHNFFSVAAIIKNKTWYLPIPYVVAAVVAIVLNYLLLPRFGYMAAAWVTVGTYTIFSATIYFTLNRFYPIPYEWGRMGILFLLGVALMVASNMWRFDSQAAEIMKQLAMLFVLPAFVLLGPFLKRDEAAEVALFLSQASPRLARLYGRIRRTPAADTIDPTDSSDAPEAKEPSQPAA